MQTILSLGNALNQGTIRGKLKLNLWDILAEFVINCSIWSISAAISSMKYSYECKGLDSPLV